MFNRREEVQDRRLTLPFEDAVDGAGPMPEKLRRNKGGAVAADKDETRRQFYFREFGQIDNLRHVGQIITGEGDDVRLPALEDADIVSVCLDLEIQ